MNVRELIQNALNEKKLKNPSYSLRALSRDMKLDVGQLHRILQSESIASPLVAYKVGKFLKMKNDDVFTLMESSLVTLNPSLKEIEMNP